MSTEDSGELLRRLRLEKYEPIAVVGVGMRMPGGSGSRAQLAEFLRAGRSGTGPIPADRWDVDALATPSGAPVEPGRIGAAGDGSSTTSTRSTRRSSASRRRSPATSTRSSG